jgi:hypothetical protein
MMSYSEVYQALYNDFPTLEGRLNQSPKNALDNHLCQPLCDRSTIDYLVFMRTEACKCPDKPRRLSNRRYLDVGSRHESCTVPLLVTWDGLSVDRPHTVSPASRDCFLYCSNTGSGRAVAMTVAITVAAWRRTDFILILKCRLPFEVCQGGDVCL